jgi:hypothetical protein
MSDGSAGGTRDGPGARRWALVAAPLYAFLACASLAFFFGDIALQPSDEGFLWYGLRRTLAGEVPLRDFQSYDPGRYYWCAALSPLLGDGILGLRAATLAFAAIGLAFGLLVAARVARGPLELGACALVLTAWLFPRHKLYEPAMAMTALWFGVRLVERPSAARHLAAGAFVGLAALVGRNHALYSGVAFVALGLFLAWRAPAGAWRRAGSAVLGLALGLAPLAALFLLVPGLFAASRAFTRLLVKHGGNVPLPYPFPWRTDWSALAGTELASTAALALAFLLPFALLPLGFLLALRTPPADLARRAVPIAAAPLALAYLHHVSVRSDAVHLGQCIAPLLFLALALPGFSSRRWIRPAGWSLLALVSVLASIEGNKVFSRLLVHGEEAATAPHSVAGETLQLPASKARQYAAMEAFVAARLPGDEPLWIVNCPGFYVMLGKTSPTWWLTFYWPPDEGEEEGLIRTLRERGVDWVMLTADADEFLDQRPLLRAHLGRDFRPVESPGLPPRVQLLQRRGERKG